MANAQGVMVMDGGYVRGVMGVITKHMNGVYGRGVVDVKCATALKDIMRNKFIRLNNQKLRPTRIRVLIK